MLKVAVRSARAQGGPLAPHCLFAGDAAAPIASWLEAAGVRLLPHEPKWRRRLVAAAGRKASAEGAPVIPLSSRLATTAAAAAPSSGRKALRAVAAARSGLLVIKDSGKSSSSSSNSSSSSSGGGSSSSSGDDDGGDKEDAVVGEWLRIDIPLDPWLAQYTFVLYTDIDIMFRQPVSLHQLPLPLPQSIGMGAHILNRFPWNAGVAVLNLPALRGSHDAFLAFVVGNEDGLVFTTGPGVQVSGGSAGGGLGSFEVLDSCPCPCPIPPNHSHPKSTHSNIQHHKTKCQGAYNLFYEASARNWRLPIKFNAKPFNARAPPGAEDAAILHFDGPKPADYLGLTGGSRRVPRGALRHLVRQPVPPRTARARLPVHQAVGGLVGVRGRAARGRRGAAARGGRGGGRRVRAGRGGGSGDRPGRRRGGGG